MVIEVDHWTGSPIMRRARSEAMLQRFARQQDVYSAMGDLIGAVTDDEFQDDNLLLIFSQPLHCLGSVCYQVVLGELLHIVAIFAADGCSSARWYVARNSRRPGVPMRKNHAERALRRV
jgi:hypothetical protein